MEDLFKIGAIIVGIASIGITTLIALYLRRIPMEMDGAVKRLSNEISKVDGRIDDLQESVVFKDVFQQFEKTQDARHQTTDKMFLALEKQMQVAVTNNATEHKNICDKLDKLFDALIHPK
jgi:hypothetical protein